MFEYTYDENGIVKSIIFSKKQLKIDLKFNIFASIFFFSAIVFLFYLHYSKGISIGVPIICTASFILLILFLFIRYGKNKQARLVFNENSLIMKVAKKSMEISYTDLKKCGVLRRVGSSRISTIFFGYSVYDEGTKHTFYFSTNENINLKKLKNNIVTLTGEDMGFFQNDTCYISDYVGSAFYVKCKEAIDYYCPDNSIEFTDQDRSDF